MNRSDYLKQYRKESKGKFHRVNATFTPEEYSAIKTIADALELKPTTLVRNLTLATLNGEKFNSPALEEEVRGLTFLLRNIANNLNQIAHHSNRVKHVVDENNVLEQLRQIEASLKEAYKRASS